MFRRLLAPGVLAAAAASLEAEPFLESGLFAADDECAASGSAGSGDCSLSALQQHAAELQRLESQPQSNTSELDGAALPKYSAQCYGFTGGTCLTSECNADRYAKCSSGMCICPSGMCTGADGKCREQRNAEVAGSFRLYNAKYSRYKMFFQRVTTFGQMKTTMLPNWANMGQDKFSLFQAPGNETAFMLGSEKWNEYVVAMRATTGTALSPFAAYAVKINTRVAPWSPDTLMLRICSLRKRSYPEYVMIGSLGKTGTPIWAYVHHGSWFVYGSMTEPGDGGYWRPDPPLPEGLLPDCP